LKFTTDLFWPESVKGFDFPKVILLFVDRAGKELYTPRLEPGKIATLIDYFALRSFAQATLHGKEDIHIEPFKLVRGRDSFLEHTDLFD
jgi:hypothetical protein